MELKRLLVSIVFTIISALIMLLVNYFSQQLLGMGENANTNHENVMKGHILNCENISERMNTIGGLAKIKEDIDIQILLPLKYPEIFLKTVSSLTPSKGVLFWGPPGTGKTMLAKAIAAESKVPFISITLSMIENKYYGESSKLLTAAFSLARKIQPCVLFFDEIDGLIRVRSDNDQSCVYGLKTEFLSLLDGINSKKEDAFFVIGSTNNISSLDSALRRRLPRVYKIDIPSEEERLDILNIISPDSHIINKKISKLTNGFSGSDLKELYSRASNERSRQYLCKDSDIRSRLCVMNDVKELMNTMKTICENHWELALRSMLSEKNLTFEEGILSRVPTSPNTGPKISDEEDYESDVELDEGAPSILNS